MNKVTARKKPVIEDWHPADIVAELHKRGMSLRQLSLDAGYKSGTALSHALVKPYPKAEAIIAAALDMKPETLWPSRYGEAGRRPYRGWSARCMFMARQHNKPAPAGNAEVSDEV